MKYRNVTEMVEDMSVSEDFKEDFRKLIKKNRLSKWLFVLKCRIINWFRGGNSG
jgi:hypothetical protein